MSRCPTSDKRTSCKASASAHVVSTKVHCVFIDVTFADKHVQGGPGLEASPIRTPRYPTVHRNSTKKKTVTRGAV
eukprot:9908022-Karenia_brevis.AAC.1